nr:MAG TPA: Helix-turn-helix XRE-family like protein [Caudoviricetes sp.]
MENKSEFAIFLKNYMEKHEYKLEAFADRVGYSFGLISHYINARRSPSYKFIREFFKKFPLTEKEKIEVLEILKKDKLPEEIMELENLSNPMYRELDSRGRMQFKEIVEQSSLMFNDENISEEDKQKVLLAIQDAFYDAKQKNKKKK